METDQNHEMVLVRTYETGAEEWRCPVCGRRFMMQRPPQYRRIILDIGDEMVSHTAAKESLIRATSETAPVKIVPRLVADGNADGHNLSVWAEWLDQLDLGTLGSTGDHR